MKNFVSFIGMGVLVLSTGCGQIHLSAYGEFGDTDGFEDILPEDENEDTDWSTPDEDAHEETDEDTDEEQPPVPECTHEGFDSVATQTTLNETNPAQVKFVHRSVNVAGYPNDELQFVSFQGHPYNGPATPGTFSVAGLNTADCGLCLLLLNSCNGPDCDKTFFARSGSVKIESLQGVGGQFQARLIDVVLEEVTVDSGTFRSTPVAGGETWCLDQVVLEDPYILPGF